MPTKTIQIKEEARQYAIEYQSLVSKSNLSYGEISIIQDELTKLAEKFDLTEEFKENGLI